MVSFMTESADELGTDAWSLDTLCQALDRRAVVLAHRSPNDRREQRARLVVQQGQRVIELQLNHALCAPVCRAASASIAAPSASPAA